MPVDPCFAPILEAMAAMSPSGAPDADPVAAARAGTEAMFAHPSPPEVASIERTVPGPGGEVRVRITSPVGAGALRPVLVYFHGGGFIAGSLDSHDGTCRELTVRAGCTTVSADYRLAPEHPYPAALEDCAAVLAWVQEHAAEIDGDPARIAVGGDSAGGNLCAAVALRNRGLGGPAPVAQALIYPVIDPACDTPSMHDNGTGLLLSADAMRSMWQAYLGETDPEGDPYVCPADAGSLAGLPPTLVITAEYDPLRDEGERFARALAADAVPVTRSRYGGQIHGFFSMYAVAPRARSANDEVARYLGRAFGR